MRLLYLTTWDFEHSEADGVCKKINTQIRVLERNGYEVDVIYVDGSSLIYKKFGKNPDAIGHLGKIKKTPAYIKMYRYIKDQRYDWVYNRHGKFDYFYFKVLKRLKQNGAGILIEVPTYPYDNERLGGFLLWVMFEWDRFYTKKIASIAERIVSPWNGEEIWGIKTLNIRNGIDVERIPLHHRDMPGNELATEKTIVLGTVAILQFYNGFERILKGLREYYDSGGEWRILFQIVGDGPEYTYYERMIEDLNLAEYVSLLGPLSGEKLDSFYDGIDIGVCSLGIYKNGVDLSSELKSREYLARGVPFILGCDLDIEEHLAPDMFYKVPNDDSTVHIKEIIMFFLRIMDRYSDISNSMRDVAERTVSSSVAFNPVINYLQGGEEDQR